MALWLQENQRVVVKRFKDGKQNLKHEEGYSTANLSSSRKKSKEDSAYLYSDWGFVRFVGKAHEYVMANVKDGDVIVLEKSMFTKEAYTNKEGERVFPKTPQLVVFSCSLYKSNRSESVQAEVEVSVDDEEEIPF